MTDNSSTCWICEKTIEPKDTQRVETNPELESYGYCYCRDCMLMVYRDLDDLRAFTPAKRGLVISLFKLSETMSSTSVKTKKFWGLAIPIILIGIPLLVILRIYKLIRRLLK